MINLYYNEFSLFIKTNNNVINYNHKLVISKDKNFT